MTRRRPGSPRDAVATGAGRILTIGAGMRVAADPSSRPQGNTQVWHGRTR